jgi:hypothetical protein
MTMIRRQTQPRNFRRPFKQKPGQFEAPGTDIVVFKASRTPLFARG